MTLPYTTPDVADATHIQAILQSIEDLTRFATRGCSATACDRVRVNWIGNQLQTIASHSAELTEQLRGELAEIPCQQIDALAVVRDGTPGGLTADEMQRFVERELPRVRSALKNTNGR